MELKIIIIFLTALNFIKFGNFVDGLLVCYKCEQEFGNYEQSIYEEHMHLHEMEEGGQNNWEFDIPRGIERYETISSERSDPVNKFWFNPPSANVQKINRTELEVLSRKLKRPPVRKPPNYDLEYKFESFFAKRNGLVQRELAQFESTKYRPNPQKVRPIIGDGNCLYRSISYGLTGSEDFYPIIRELVARQLEENREELWVTSNIQRNYFERHVWNVRNTSTFGEIPDVIAAAKAFKVNILLFWKQWVRIRGRIRSKHLWMVFTPDTKTSSDADVQNRRLPTIPIQLFKEHYQVILGIDLK